MSRVAARSDDRHEDIDNVVAAVVLERRSCVVGVRPLREALRCRPDLLIDTRRLAVETHARVPSSGERATLRAKLRRVIVWPEYRAHAVGICHRIERPVELASAQANGGFERGPGPLDLRQLVCDSHEHDVRRLTHNDVLRAHA